MGSICTCDGGIDTEGYDRGIATEKDMGLVGHSAAFESILETVKTIACRESSVVIMGETGTGKEVVAREIHRQSSRSSGPLVPVDCTTLSGHVFESQLFGHMKGAFTGAVSDTLGFFRAADGGTVFLDEIGEIDLDLQAKLLRVLQESEVTPVGSTRAYPIDVRVICATHRDLKHMVREGTFRADLYFRLNVIKLEVAPLRERREDIMALANHFLDKQAQLYREPRKSLSSSAIEILRNYDWPGNVRELANVIEHAYITSPGDVVEPSSLPKDILIGDLMLPRNEESFPSLDEMKRRLVIRALQASEGRKMNAAKLLKIDHRKLSRLVDRFDIQPSWK